MASTDDYVKLITSEHRDKVNFIAVLRTLVQGLVDINNMQAQLPADFDLDVAVGVQLDQVGVWIGASRVLTVPLPVNSFSWDTVSVGWDAGVWAEDDTPTTGLTVLGDEDYRTFLKAKIGANQWDGTLPTLIAIMEAVFAGTNTKVFATDEQNMHMTVGLSGALPTPTQIALLQGGYLVPKPFGVSVDYYTTTVDGSALFGFDVENEFIQGWDVGAWGLQT